MLLPNHGNGSPRICRVFLVGHDFQGSKCVVFNHSLLPGGYAVPCSSPVKMQHSTSTVQCSMARNESYCVMNGCFFFLFLSLLSHLVSCLSICGCGFIPAANILSEMQQHRYRTVLSFGMAMYSRATLRVATDKDLPAERETYPLSSRMSHYSKNPQWL